MPLLQREARELQEFTTLLKAAEKVMWDYLENPSSQNRLRLGQVHRRLSDFAVAAHERGSYFAQAAIAISGTIGRFYEMAHAYELGHNHSHSHSH